MEKPLSELTPDELTEIGKQRQLIFKRTHPGSYDGKLPGEDEDKAGGFVNALGQEGRRDK